MNECVRRHPPLPVDKRAGSPPKSANDISRAPQTAQPAPSGDLMTEGEMSGAGMAASGESGDIVEN